MSIEIEIDVDVDVDRALACDRRAAARVPGVSPCSVFFYFLNERTNERTNERMNE